MNLMGELKGLIKQRELARLKERSENGDVLLRKKPVFGGGTWVHYAATYGSPEILEWLQSLGFDLNEPASYQGDRPISGAAWENNIANARWLLDQHVMLDTDASVRNPLFASITGEAPEIIQMLLDAGIDATVRYNSPTMEDMDAMAFALFRGAVVGPSTLTLATLIARHLANGDLEEMNRLLEDAQRRAQKNGTPKKIRLVPTEEELSRMEWDQDGNLISG